MTPLHVIIIVISAGLVVWALLAFYFDRDPETDVEYLKYQTYAIGREWEESQKQLAINQAKWEECKRIEDEAWEQYYREWSEKNRITVKVGDQEITGFTWGGMAFRTFRAILITDSELQMFFPNLPPRVH